MIEPMRVLVADDELLARKRLLRLLAAIDGVTIAGECENGHLVLERLTAKDVDVILLDIHMPGLSGIETAALLPEDGPVIVLCTAHPDHAVDAFEQGAADYILKPVEAGRLKKALDRARSRLAERTHGRDGGAHAAEPGAPHAGAGDEARPLDRLAIPTRAGTGLSDDTLNDLQDRLPRDSFERVHRRALLNLEHVVRLEPLETGGFLAFTRGGHSIEVSRQAARELRKRLKLR